MTGNLRWHSCSTNDFPLKRHKVSKACEACRGKKMRCDGKNPCQRCESNKIKCIYNDKPVRSRSITDSTTVKLPTSTTNKKIRLSSSSSSSSTTTSSSPPPPKPTKVIVQQQQQIISIPCLNKITFINELYETLRLQQSPKTRRYGTSISPLLLDFFNTTSQPQTIWTYFIVCLNRFCDSQPIPNNAYFMRDAPEIESNELVKETFRVFVTHNSLYGSFIDTQLLLFVLDSVSMFSYMQQSSPSPTSPIAPESATAATTAVVNNNHLFDESSLPYYSIIIYCILAITFQSAYQSLPNMNENFTNSLYIYSHVFYREAHKRFLSTCFPTIPADPTVKDKTTSQQKRRHMIILVQASVLLTHFQCTAISEEQAFMTIKLGLSLAHQCSLTAMNNDDDDDDEKESLFALLKSLDAWLVWLAFYLQKPYSVQELDMTHISPNTIAELQQDDNDMMFMKKSIQQRWALYVTDAYIVFLKSLLKKKKSNQSISLRTIKDSLKLLNAIISNDDDDERDELIPNNIISLYHDILTIQLYTCQLDNHLWSNDATTIDITDNNSELATMDVIQMCISSSQNILTTVNKVIFVEYNNTNATAPLKYVPLSIIYSICLISQVSLFFLHNNNNSNSNKKLLATNQKEIDYLRTGLVKMLKIASPYFEAFQILYSKFITTSSSSKMIDTVSNSKGAAISAAIISPSPSSLSTSSSTTTTTTTSHTMNAANAAVVAATEVTINTSLAPETQHFLSSIHNNNSNSNDLLMAVAETQQHNMSMNLPVTGGIVRSRADIDREQLEKLSHNKSSSYHHQQQLQFQQQLLLQKQQQQQLSQFQFHQQQTPNSTYYLQKYMQQSPSKRNHGGLTTGFNSQQQQHNNVHMNEQQQYYYYNNGNNSSGQKRSHHHQQQQQQQLYNQFGYSMTQQQQQPSVKRHRSNTATSYDELTAKSSGGHPSTMVVEDDSQQHQQHERSKSVTAAATNGFMDLEPNNDAFMYNIWMLEGATAATEEPSFFDSRSHKRMMDNAGFTASAVFLQQQQQQQEMNNNNLLPLPQPSKQTSMIPKNWSAPAPSQTWSKLFFDSEVQTLHYQTPPLIHFESNSSFPMVGLNVIQEEGEDASGAAGGNATSTTTGLMYPSHRASLISEHSSGSSSSGGIMPTATVATANNNNNATAVTSSQASTEETTVIEAEAAAAAAAEAVWASTAAAVAVAANVSFSSSNNKNSNNRRHHYNNNNAPTANNGRNRNNNDMENTTDSNRSLFPNQQQQQQGASNTAPTSTATGHWINSEKVGDEEYWGE